MKVQYNRLTYLRPPSNHTIFTRWDYSHGFSKRNPSLSIPFSGKLSFRQYKPASLIIEEALGIRGCRALVKKTVGFRDD